MKIQAQQILLLILGFVLGCDRIKDTPEPDYFTRFNPKTISISLLESGGKTIFNVLDSNLLKSEYRIIVGNPVFGSLIAGASPGLYEYVSPSGFSGKDSVAYQICVGEICKSAWISFYVPAKSCRMRAFNDAYSYPLNDTLFLPVLENDTFCSGGLIQLSNQPPVGSIRVKGNQIALLLPEFYEGSVSFPYTLKSGTDSSSAQVNVTVSLTGGYCDRKFKAVNDTITLLQGFHFKTFKPEDLIFNDIQCNGAILPGSFAIVPSPPSNPLYQLKFQQNRWWFLVKQPQNFTSGTFQYKVCTNSGKCDTATVVIKTL